MCCSPIGCIDECLAFDDPLASTPSSFVFEAVEDSDWTESIMWNENQPATIQQATVTVQFTNESN